MSRPRARYFNKWNDPSFYQCRGLVDRSNMSHRRKLVYSPEAGTFMSSRWYGMANLKASVTFCVMLFHSLPDTSSSSLSDVVIYQGACVHVGVKIFKLNVVGLRSFPSRGGAGCFNGRTIFNTDFDPSKTPRSFNKSRFVQKRASPFMRTAL